MTQEQFQHLTTALAGRYRVVREVGGGALTSDEVRGLFHGSVRFY